MLNFLNEVALVTLCGQVQTRSGPAHWSSLIPGHWDSTPTLAHRCFQRSSLRVAPSPRLSTSVLIYREQWPLPIWFANFCSTFWLKSEIASSEFSPNLSLLSSCFFFRCFPPPSLHLFPLKPSFPQPPPQRLAGNHTNKSESWVTV